MSLYQRTKFGQISLTETGLSGDSGEAFSISSPIPTKEQVPGSLTALVKISNTVASCALAPLWYVSNDGFNADWRPLNQVNSVAVTALTGSTSFWYEAPAAIQAYEQAGLFLLSSGGSNAAPTTVKVATSFNWEVPLNPIGYRVRKSQSAASGTTSAVSGTTIAGPTLKLEDVTPGSLAANLDVSSASANWTATPVWQASDDGVSWYAFKPTGAVANTSVITGSGASAANTISLAVEAPLSLATHRYARLSILTGGATASVAKESYTISYNYLKRIFN